MTERTFLDGLLDDLCGAYGRFLQTGKADELNAEWQRIIDAVRDKLVVAHRVGAVGEDPKSVSPDEDDYRMADILMGEESKE